jgi:hypothetical protein
MSSMKELFARYLGQTIGLNFKEAAKYHAITLVGVKDDYFSVQASDRRAIAHFPFRQVLSVMESAEGIPISGFGLLKAPTVPFVVQTYVMPSGGTVVGVVFSG